MLKIFSKLGKLFASFLSSNRYFNPIENGWYDIFEPPENKLILYIIKKVWFKWLRVQQEED